MHAFISAGLYTCMHAQIHAGTQACMKKKMYASTHAFMHTCMRAHMHACTHTCCPFPASTLKACLLLIKTRTHKNVPIIELKSMASAMSWITRYTYTPLVNSKENVSQKKLRKGKGQNGISRGHRTGSFAQTSDGLFDSCDGTAQPKGEASDEDTRHPITGVSANPFLG
jgi:hypothetical protein